MNRDDVIRMAREAGFLVSDVFGTYVDVHSIDRQLERFAQLVAAQAAAEEREACSKVCEDYVATWQVTGRQYAAAIRARGTA